MPHETDDRDVCTFDLCPSCWGRGGSCEACYGEGTGPGQGRSWRGVDRSENVLALAFFALAMLGLLLIVWGASR